MSFASFQKSAQMWHVILGLAIPILGMVWLGATKWAEVASLQLRYESLENQIMLLEQKREADLLEQTRQLDLLEQSRALDRADMSEIKVKLARMDETLMWLKDNR